MSARVVDITGQRFGRWSVLALHLERCRNGGTLWLCHCDCGTVRIVRGDGLRDGESTNCGCFQREVARKQLIDLTGQRFGRWVVSALHPERRASREAFWLCHCDCGIVRIVRGDSLRAGASNSCGCLQRELQRKRATTHGMSQTRAYKTWAGMLSRCFDPNHPHYHYYGGRGITVCKRWLSFVNYFAVTGHPPPGKSLDRINNDGNYEPGNVRWATAAEQVRNRRPSKRKCRRANLAEIRAYSDALARAAGGTP